MQVGDLITLINDQSKEVEVEVMKIYNGKDEQTNKPSVLADLKETATGRLHVFVPAKPFVKGARKIFYYLDRAVSKPTPQVAQTTVPQPVAPKPIVQPQKPVQPQPIKTPTVDPLAVTEEPLETTAEPSTVIPTTTMPEEVPPKKTGTAKQIGVEDTITATDK